MIWKLPEHLKYNDALTACRAQKAELYSVFGNHNLDELMGFKMLQRFGKMCQKCDKVFYRMVRDSTQNCLANHKQFHWKILTP